MAGRPEELSILLLPLATAIIIPSRILFLYAAVSDVIFSPSARGPFRAIFLPDIAVSHSYILIVSGPNSPSADATPAQNIGRCTLLLL